MQDAEQNTAMERKYNQSGQPCLIPAGIRHMSERSRMRDIRSMLLDFFIIVFMFTEIKVANSWQTDAAAYLDDTRLLITGISSLILLCYETDRRRDRPCVVT